MSQFIQTKPLTAKGTQRIDSVMSVAADLFLEHGYEAISIDDIVNIAGGSRRNIYNYFGGKEGLFIESMSKLCMELSQPLEQMDLGTGSLREVLIKFGQKVLSIVLESKTLELHRLMIAEGKRFPELSQAIFQSGHKRAAIALSKWLEKNLYQQNCINFSAVELSQYFVNMLIAETQLQALIGLISLPINEIEQDLIVEKAVEKFLSPLL